MKPAPFAYHRPETVADAVRLLAELAPQDGRVLAGGQSLVPIMAFRLARPAHLIDINAVAGLDRLAVRGRQCCASARGCAMRRSIARWCDGPLGGDAGRLWCGISRIIRSGCAARSAAASRMPIRRRNGALVAATLDAELVAVSTRGERRIAARDFFRGAMETALMPDELLAEARLPLPAGRRPLRLCRIQPPRRRLRAGHGAGGAATSTAASSPRRASGSAAPKQYRAASQRPRRCCAAQTPGEAVFRAAAAAAAAAIEPLEDPQTDARYRRELVAAMVYRALTQACAQGAGA